MQLEMHWSAGGRLWPGAHKVWWRVDVKCWLDGRFSPGAHKADSVNLRRQETDLGPTNQCWEKSTIYRLYFDENTPPGPIKWKNRLFISIYTEEIFYDIYRFFCFPYITLKYHMIHTIYQRFLVTWDKIKI